MSNEIRANCKLKFCNAKTKKRERAACNYHDELVSILLALCREEKVSGSRNNQQHKPW